MGFWTRLFSKSSDDYLAKADALFERQCFFEARTICQDGLQALAGKGDGQGSGPTADLFITRIARANRALAEMNLSEADSCIRCGKYEKAGEHLELAKSLSDDRAIWEKANQLLAALPDNSASDDKKTEIPSAGSCGSCNAGETEQSSVLLDEEPDMSDQDYYDLLIRQLPDEIHTRYARLGDQFASMYLTASRDNHEKALVLLEEWYKGTDADIYWYEKGMILYRLGRSSESEACFREAILLNAANPLPRLSLALLLIDLQQREQAGLLLDAMIAEDVLSGQALMLRADLALLAGDQEGALNRLAMLLTTPYVRPAAEKLHQILLQAGRDQEAAAVFKRYLGGCRH
jgi:tetratricopeptide (TPR) repeat protein